MRAYFQLFFVLVLSLLSACTGADKLPAECYTPAGCSSEQSDTADTGTPADTDTDSDSDADTDADSDTDTDADSDTDSDTDTDITDEINCWYDVPFEIKDLIVDRTLAEIVPGNWTELDWIDFDQIYIEDASSNSIEIEINTICGSSASEGTIWIPDDFVMCSESDELYNNGVFAALQPNGKVLEVNYFEDCGDGTYAGYILPDSSPFGACDLGYDMTRYVGAHGGSHATATQAIQPGELTNEVAIGRPLPVEVDHTHLYCDPLETDGLQCFTGPLASSGDREGDEIYTGEIEGLTMGGILVLEQDYDCEGLMRTTPGLKLCQVARDHFFFIVDDSYGENEVAFPMEVSVPDEVEAEFGIQLHNATGDYASDVEDIFLSILVVANPDDEGVIK